MGYTTSLSGLSTREQITDALTRACLGLDRNDKTLWESAWAADTDIVLDINGTVMTGLDAINKDCLEKIGPMETQHLTTGIRVDVADGATTAHVTANAMNQHFRAGEALTPGADHMLAGSTYDIQMVQEASGEWKIKTWRLKLIWTQGTWAVMQPA